MYTESLVKFQEKYVQKSEKFLNMVIRERLKSGDRECF